MTRSRRVLRWTVCAVLACIGACGSGEPPDEPVLPYDGLLPPAQAAAASADFVATRVVDATTGLPLPGAHVRAYAYDLPLNVHPQGQLLGEAVTNEDGFAWMPRPEPDAAPVVWRIDVGDAVETAEQEPLPAEIPVRRGRSVTARVLDAAGAPVVGAVVEHVGEEWARVPPLFATRTAADGTFTLPSVRTGDEDGGIWILAPGAIAELVGVLRLLRWGTRRADVVLRAGIAVEGTVVDASGAPVAGVVLQTTESLRHPFAVTDREGRFQLSGTFPGSDLWVLPPGTSRGIEMERVTGERPLRLRLGEKGLVWDETAETDVEATVRSSVDGSPVARLYLRLVRDDGRSWDFATDAHGTARTTVPAGDYRLVEPSPFGRARVTPADVRVVAGETTRVVLTAEPRVRVEVLGGPSDLAWVRLSASGRSLLFKYDVEDMPPAEAWLDADVPAVVSHRDRFYPVEPARDGVRRATIRPPPATRIRLRDDREIAEGYVRPRDFEGETFTDVVDNHLEAYVTGPALVRISPNEGPPLEFEVDLPAEPGGEVVLDPAHTAPEPTAADDTGRAWLHVRRADGSGPPPMHVTSRDPRTGRVQVVDVPTSPVQVLAPAHVTVEAQGMGTLKADVATETEQELTWPAGVLRLTVTDASGTPIPAMALVDGSLHRIDAGRLSVEGLAGGPHRVIVSPVTWKKTAVELRVVLKEGETRAKTVTLPDR